MIDRETFAGMVIANGKMVQGAIGIQDALVGATANAQNIDSPLSAFGIYTPVTVSSYTVTRGKNADLERDQSRD
jgi:hypothetical protein